ncbi:dynein intermediate chain 4, axonemal-like [Lytechinus variegatus]|uniref:dynein intermediate chain 4, axonemal-like n=1 Tax=Lytechinus variegatus TaxID=7654 RepID=UPI001BB1FF2C|nr:dynein intermediate chain 4, axonemal-like [Lytechinus variegatus]XP_041475349.1 dynein intermediate chain 4, axonemal-like [Lytechinus variegatus]
MLKLPGGQNASSVMKSSKISGSTSQNRIGKDRNVTLGIGSRTTLNSSRKSQVGIDSKTEHHKLPGAKFHNIQVLDDEGQDVTPQPLIAADPSSVKQQQSKLFNAGESSHGTPTDLMSQASIYQTGTTSFAGPFTRSVFGASMSHASSQSNTESFTDEIAEPTSMKDMLSGLEDIQTRREETKEDLTEEDLEKYIPINLTETATIWLLDINGVSMSIDAEDASAIKSKNEKYKELCKSRDGNDRYAERGMQTFNDLPKNKDIQTSRVNYIDQETIVNNWDMYDTYQDQERKANSQEYEFNESDQEKKRIVERPKSTKSGVSSIIEEDSGKNTSSKTGEGKASMVNASMVESEIGEGEGEGEETKESSGKSHEEILASEELKEDLFVMERVVTMNILQHKQAAYRNLPIYPDVDRVEPEETESQASLPTAGTAPSAPPTSTANQVALTQLGPNLDRLWAYSCSLTKGRNVSCMAWNKGNPDLIAVGYGQFGFTEQKGGLACCWSLKNPEYPERVFNCEAGVTAMDFSGSNPNLLAVGLYNGTVAIYNVRASSDEPILDSYESRSKHAAPVWQLQWVDKERGSSNDERIEVLVSISTDGRVTQWQIRKGFESAELMKLKKTAKAAKKQASQAKQDQKEKGEAFITRQAAGFSFDFYPKDSNIYLAGTEDGLIHKCSCSYNEQYLDTYNGHTGPIYKIRWSPFINDIFLSCSADWSLRLWMQDRLQPVLNFFSSTKAVMDVCWSPTSPTVFGCVNEGAVEIWDLSVNTLDPIIVNVPAPGVKLSCLTFAFNSDCILVGDSEGQVSVYQLRCMPPVEDDQSEKLKQLLQQTIAGQLRT